MYCLSMPLGLTPSLARARVYRRSETVPGTVPFANDRPVRAAIERTAPVGPLASGLEAPDAGAGGGVPAVPQATSRTPSAMDNSPGRHQVRPCLVRMVVVLSWCQPLRGQAHALCYS